jgi:hypothetical protein
LTHQDNTPPNVGQQPPPARSAPAISSAKNPLTVIGFVLGVVGSVLLAIGVLGTLPLAVTGLALLIAGLFTKDSSRDTWSKVLLAIVIVIGCGVIGWLRLYHR